jgi:type II secretory pathway pseudopilin PulG
VPGGSRRKASSSTTTGLKKKKKKAGGSSRDADLLREYRKDYPHLPLSTLRKAIALQCLPTDIKTDTAARLADRFAVPAELEKSLSSSEDDEQDFDNDDDEDDEEEEEEEEGDGHEEDDDAGNGEYHRNRHGQGSTSSADAEGLEIQLELQERLRSQQAELERAREELVTLAARQDAQREMTYDFVDDDDDDDDNDHAEESADTIRHTDDASSAATRSTLGRARGSDDFDDNYNDDDDIDDDDDDDQDEYAQEGFEQLRPEDRSPKAGKTFRSTRGGGGANPSRDMAALAATRERLAPHLERVAALESQGPLLNDYRRFTAPKLAAMAVKAAARADKVRRALERQLARLGKRQWPSRSAQVESAAVATEIRDALDILDAVQMQIETARSGAAQ